MVSVSLTPRQEDMTRALVKCGYFGNVSEVTRAAIDLFVASLHPSRRLDVALALYRDGKATVSRVAEIADLPFHEARQILIREGILVSGSGEPASERKRKVKAGLAKYR